MNGTSVLSKRHGVVAGVIKGILWVYSTLTFVLLIYMTYNSLRTKTDILSNTFGVPESLSLQNYIKLFSKDHFLRYFANSVVILVIALTMLILISSTTAYGIARYRFKGRKFFRVYFLIGMMFPVQLGIVPLFQMMKNLGLVNNPLSIILISVSSISMPVFMLTNFFSRLPKEIYEAAIIDGAGEFTAFRKIMLPMASPVIFSVCITNSVTIWNQFFLPLILLQKEANKTVPQLVIKYTGSQLVNNIDLAMAASTLATIPVLILFLVFAQRILDGVIAGGVKG